MKKNTTCRWYSFTFLFCMLLLLSTHKSFAQTDIVIKNPNGLNDLWVQVLDNGNVEEGQVFLVGNTQPQCAGLAMIRFRRNINNLGLMSSLKDVASGAFTALGLVVPSGYAKYALLALKMTYKAMSADSPEEFEDAAVKEAIKQIGGAGLKVKDSKILEKALKEGYKKIVDNLLKSAKKDLYNKPLTIEPCKNGSVKITLEPPATGDTSMQFTLSFAMDEECDCLYPPASVSGNPVKLKKYNIWGSMPVTIKTMEFDPVTVSFPGHRDKINLTLEYGKPEFHVDATCGGCGDVSYISPNDFYASASTIFEDSKPNGFNTFGGDVSYMHPVSTNVGVMADAGVYFGSNNSTNYTKAQILIGASFLPVQYNRNELSFSPHVLAGVSNVSAKYSAITSSSTALAAAAGVDVRFPINKKTGVTFRADYNPVFNTGGVSSNFRLSLGMDWKMLRAKK